MLTCQKDAFSLPADLHYLNCAYMAPLPRAAEAAGIAGMRQKRVPSAIQPADFFEESDEARRRFARLIHAPDPRRVAIVPAASYGIASAARNTPVERGQNIVISEEQFPSNVHIWRTLSREQGVELRTVRRPAAEEGRGREWSARVLEAIDARTAIVALPHVHWTDGTRFDLAAIGERARAHGAALIVDGTQSVGALEFDVRAIQPDALVCAAYKWLLGPYSIGLAYYGPRYDGGTPLEEGWIARAGSEDFPRLVDYGDVYRPGALRYDVGERSNFILLPMVIASLELVLGWGVAGIQEYCRGLTRELLGDVASRGFTVEAEPWRAAHLFGLRMPEGLDAVEVQAALRQRNVAVSVRGGALRISPHVYNDEADIRALADALVAVA